MSVKSYLASLYNLGLILVEKVKARVKNYPSGKLALSTNIRLG
jgi:hypothetical protein